MLFDCTAICCSNPISTDIALRRYASMVLLEKSICSARALHSRDEYRYYMLTYVRNLVQDGWSFNLVFTQSYVLMSPLLFSFKTMIL